MSFQLVKRFTQTSAEGKFYTGGPVLAGPGGSLLCFCQNRLTILDAETGLVRSSLQVTEEESDGLSAMALHPSLSRLLVFTRGLECVELDLVTLEVIRRTRTQHQQAILGARFDASGLCFATCSADRTLRVFDYSGLYCTHCFRNFTGVVTDVGFLDAFRQDGGTPGEGSSGAIGAPRYVVGLSRTECHVYDLLTKTFVGKISEHMNSVSSFCLIGDVIATSGKDGCVIFTRIVEGGDMPAASEAASDSLRDGSSTGSRASLLTLKTVNIQECFLYMVFVSYDSFALPQHGNTESVGGELRKRQGEAPPAFIIGPSFEDGSLMVLDLHAAFCKDGESPFFAPATLSGGDKPELVYTRANTPTEVLGYVSDSGTPFGGSRQGHSSGSGPSRYLDLPVVKGMSLNNGWDMSLSNTYFSACAMAQSVALEEDDERRKALLVSPADIVTSALSSPVAAVELSETYRSSYLFPEVMVLRRHEKGPASMLLVAPTSDNLIHIFDLLSLTLLPALASSESAASVPGKRSAQAPRFCALAVSTLVGESGEILSLCQASDSEIIAATATHFLRVQRAVFSEEDPLYQRLYEERPCYGHSDYVSCLAAVPERGVFVSGSRDGTIRVWKRNGRVAHAQYLFLHSPDVLSGKTGGASPPSEVRSSCAPCNPALFVSPWECVAILAGHQDGVEAVALSFGSDAFCVSGGDDKILRLYDLSVLPFMRRPKAEEPMGPALSTSPVVLAPATAVMAHSDAITSLLIAPNQEFIVSTSADLSVKLWMHTNLVPLAFGSERQGICKKNIWASDLSPVERLLAVACGDRRIRVLRVSASSPPSVTLHKTLEGHLNSVLQVKFINEGQQLVSSGADGLVKLWNLSTGECLFTLAPRPPSEMVSELIAQGVEDAGFEAEIQRLELLRSSAVRGTEVLASEAERKLREKAVVEKENKARTPSGRAKRINLSRAKATAPRAFSGKIYALQVMKNCALVIGLTNGLLCCAADTTALYAQLEEQAKREELLEAHEFGVCLQNKDMARAFELALRIYIRSGYRRYEEVVKAVAEISDSSVAEAPVEAVSEAAVAVQADAPRLSPLAQIISQAGLAQLPNLLHLCQKLNHSSQAFEYSQILLEAIFEAFPPGVSRQAYDTQLDPLLDDLLNYQRKHLARLEKYRVWAGKAELLAGN